MRHCYYGETFGKIKVIDKRELSTSEKAHCICECGKEKDIRLWSLKGGNVRSCGCGLGSVAENLIGKRFGKLVIIKLFGIGKFRKTLWLCKCDCGGEKITTGERLKNGKTKSCGCMTSFGEDEISRILTKNNLKFIHQKIFDDCVNTLPLSFDFYIPSLDYCIEFDGIQHEVPVKHFGGVKSFMALKKNDKIKDEYCRNNGIILLRIKYNEIDFIEDILLEHKIIEENENGN